MASSTEATRAIKQTYADDGDRGINYANVENAKAKFLDYIHTIDSAFEDFKSSITKYGSSFFGEQEAAIKQYVNNIMDASAQILSLLTQFAPQLDEAAAAYRAQDAAMASGLTSTN